MKKYFLILFLIVTLSKANAQTGYNYYLFGLGLGANLSYERAYTDIPKEYHHIAGGLDFNYNWTPFICTTVEFQIGTLSGGGLITSLDPLQRQFTNNYEALILQSDVQLGQIINYDNSHFLNFIKNVYLGTGLGVLASDLTVQRTSITQPGYIFPGSNSAINLIIPLRVGYEIKLYDKYDESRIAFDLGYTRNLILGNGITGYDDPANNSINKRLDQYGQFTLGVKYFLGRLHSYKKVIRGFDPNK